MGDWDIPHAGKRSPYLVGGLLALLITAAACGNVAEDTTPVPPAPVAADAPTTAAAPTPTEEAPMPTPEVATITGSLSPDIEADADAAMSLFHSEFSGSLLIAKPESTEGHGWTA